MLLITIMYCISNSCFGYICKSKRFLSNLMGCVHILKWFRKSKWLLETSNSNRVICFLKISSIQFLTWVLFSFIIFCMLYRKKKKIIPEVNLILRVKGFRLVVFIYLLFVCFFLSKKYAKATQCIRKKGNIIKMGLQQIENYCICR